MKKIIVLSFILATAFSCKGKKQERESITITTEEVADIVHYLASDELKGRNTGTDGIDKAAAYIEKQLKSYGVNPYFDMFLDRKSISCEILDNVNQELDCCMISSGVYEFRVDGKKVTARYSYVFKKINNRMRIVNHHSSELVKI